MAWCRHATSHYLNQFWSRSRSPYGVTRPQGVKGKLWIQTNIKSISQDMVSNSIATVLELPQSCTKNHQNFGMASPGHDGLKINWDSHACPGRYPLIPKLRNFAFREWAKSTIPLTLVVECGNTNLTTRVGNKFCLEQRKITEIIFFSHHKISHKLCKSVAHSHILSNMPYSSCLRLLVLRQN